MMALVNGRNVEIKLANNGVVLFYSRIVIRKAQSKIFKKVEKIVKTCVKP